MLVSGFVGWYSFRTHMFQILLFHKRTPKVFICLQYIQNYSRSFYLSQQCRFMLWCSDLSQIYSTFDMFEGNFRNLISSVNRFAKTIRMSADAFSVKGIILRWWSPHLLPSSINVLEYVHNTFSVTQNSGHVLR